MSEIRLYRIIRGQFGRREDTTGKPDPKGKYRLYRAGTDTDEVLMTEKEAAQYGLPKLQHLSARREVRAEVEHAASAPSPVPDEESESNEESVKNEESESNEDSGHSEQRALVESLIEKGSQTKDTASYSTWKREVEQSGLLDEVPGPKVEIIAALEELLE